MNNSCKLLACAVAVAALGAGPAQAVAKQRHPKPHAGVITGVVVHENNAAGSFVVAERSGKLDAIHGHRRPVGAEAACAGVPHPNRRAIGDQ